MDNQDKGDLLYRVEIKAPRSKVVSTNSISSAMFGHPNEVRGAFYGMKLYLQKETTKWFKDYPCRLTQPVKEICTIGNPSGLFDPVNYHPSEKVITDVLIKNGFLPDDNCDWIPFVTFQSFKGHKRKEWLFRLDFYALTDWDRELLSDMEEGF